MEDNERIRIGVFVSKSYGEGVRSVKTGSRKKRNGKRRRRGSGSDGGVYLLIRLGVCAAAFLAVLGLKLFGSEAALAVIGNLTEDSEERGEDESLGRLRLVELPSIVEVFAPSDRAITPVAARGFETLGDDGGIRLEAEPGADVLSPMAGRVKARGTDPELGSYVSILAGDDVEFTIYGMGSISAEEGEPVAQRQKLGTTLGSSVTVRAWKNGRPLDLGELFGLAEGF